MCIRDSVVGLHDAIGLDADLVVGAGLAPEVEVGVVGQVDGGGGVTRRLIPDPEPRSVELVERRYESAMTPGHLEASRHLVDGRRLSHLERDVAKLKTETLLLWGRQDWMVPVEGVLRALSALPHLQVHIRYECYVTHNGYNVQMLRND